MFVGKKAMQKNVTHYCLLREIFKSYYFNYKAVVYNWWSQSLLHGINHVVSCSRFEKLIFFHIFRKYDISRVYCKNFKPKYEIFTEL